MKKQLVLFVNVLLFAFGVNAAHSAYTVFDDEVFKKVIELSSTQASDVELYKKIFADIDKGEIKSADKNIKKLKGTALTGHVLAQKYLSKKYEATYEELKDWLKKYTYLPQYSQIKELSITKAPGYKKPEEPEVKKIYASYGWYRDKYEKLTAKNREYVKEQLDEFVKAIRKGDNDGAAKIMKIHKFRMTIPDKNYDAMSATLAGAYFLDGDNKSALKWVPKAIRRSNDTIAMWWGGLAAWRSKDYKLAASYFSKLGNMQNEDEWLTAAGSYWAYRSYMMLKEPDDAAKSLRTAAKYNKTFYGILAGYMLTQKVEYDWSVKVHFNDFSDKKYVTDLTSNPNIRRAILLLAAGQEDLAEDDLKTNLKKFNNKQKEILLHLSKQYSLANLSYVISNNLKSSGKNIEYNNFMYPKPTWKPESGWKINPAWVWALARQESLFSPKVLSHAGACGIMQVMPATAALVTKDNSLKEDWSPLLNKHYNIDIGQNYIQILRNDEQIGDNLFYLAASYNAGPHNVKKWFDRHDYGNDPLMFIEMIPWRETRLYVKKVVANYWIYSARYGYTSQSLQQVLDSKFPMLDEMETIN